MYKEKTRGFEVGMEYRVGKILVKDRKIRESLIALGIIPGESIRVEKCMFWGYYWVIRVRKQSIGLRLSELKWLQLHAVHN